MKKVICLVLASLLVSSLFALSGCSTNVQEKEPQILKSYPMEKAPSQVIKTDNGWVMLLSDYDGQNYTVSVSESLDSATDVYSVGDVSIWYFEANEKGIVWCEKSDEFYTYKAYIYETQNIETFFEVAVDDGFQLQNVGIFLNAVYYSIVDYEQHKARVLAYDFESKTTSVVCEAPFFDEKQLYAINVENGYLSFICSDQIKVFNLQGDEIVFDTSLPSDVKYVFSVSYDSLNNVCALYYMDKDSEDIGFFKEGEDKISSVFTFSNNHYAYQDKIKCYDGHIYWITQANVSGYVSDHYRLIDYNYLKHTVIETDRTFCLYRSENDLYSLRFNKKEYTHIDLCQY